jgi:hypothetical protein
MPEEQNGNRDTRLDRIERALEHDTETKLLRESLRDTNASVAGMVGRGFCDVSPGAARQASDSDRFAAL